MYGLSISTNLLHVLGKVGNNGFNKQRVMSNSFLLFNSVSEFLFKIVGVNFDYVTVRTQLDKHKMKLKLKMKFDLNLEN